MKMSKEERTLIIGTVIFNFSSSVSIFLIVITSELKCSILCFFFHKQTVRRLTLRPLWIQSAGDVTQNQTAWSIIHRTFWTR